MTLKKCSIAPSWNTDNVLRDVSRNQVKSRQKKANRNNTCFLSMFFLQKNYIQRHESH